MDAPALSGRAAMRVGARNKGEAGAPASPDRRDCMNNRQNGRRRRGGGGNAPRPMGMGGGQGGNRLEIRVRGNANQLLEKYKQLARDAHQSGDRVAAEYYLQHADHYFRVLNDSRIRQEEMRARRGIFDPLDDDVDADEAADAAPREDRAWRRDEGNRGWNREDRAEPDEAEPVQAAGDPDAPRGEMRSQGRRDEPRRGQGARPQRQPRADDGEAPALSDGEAALVAFGGAPAEPAESEAPSAPRRPRTRTRRSETAPVEG